MNDSALSLFSALGQFVGVKSLSADSIALYWEGFVTTIQLTFISLILGLCLAMVFALIRAVRLPFVHRPVTAFTYLFRSTPLLIQLYLIYFGLGQIETDSALWRMLISSPFWLAIFAFMLNTAAYTTEIIYGAIKKTPAGQIEAAMAYGMDRGQTLRRVVLPNALRRALPAYGNEVIFMLHATTIASAVTLTDITGAALQVLYRTYDGFTPYVVAAVLYMVLSFALQAAFRRLERRLLIPTQPAFA